MKSSGVHFFIALIFLCFAGLENTFSQGNKAGITQTVPTQITVCGEDQNFTATIKNTSASALTAITITVTMPSGMNYVPGSVTGSGASEFNIATANTPIFSLPDIPSGGVVTITYKANADCDLIAYQSIGNSIVNSIRIDYAGNYDADVSLPYNLLIPSLVITSVLNQSYTGNTGTTFTRTITVTNSGSGRLSECKITDVHGAGIQIISVANGSLSGNAGNDTINIQNFTGVGNNDAFLDKGESINIVETIKIVDCANVNSDIEAFWGCNNKKCQSSTTTANVIVPNGVPNLVFSAIPSTETCLDISIPRNQVLKISNNGTGSARNIVVDIYQTYAAGWPYLNFITSKIDSSSFTLQNGVNGTPLSVQVDSSVATRNDGFYNTDCLGPDAVGRVFIKIPILKPGDTLILKWVSYTCCQKTSCGDPTIQAYDGWAYRTVFQDQCLSATYSSNPGTGAVYKYNVISAIPSYPTDILDGETKTFSFVFQRWETVMDLAPGAYYDVVFNLPPCLKWSGNLSDINWTGINGSTAQPDSVSYVGSQILLRYKASKLFAALALYQSQFDINLTEDCSLPGCSGGANAVSFNIYLTPDPSCAQCKPTLVSCTPITYNAHCPITCPEGMVFLGYRFARTSYGQPDNNEDGVPDAVGTLNFSKIKTDRAMYGDTVTGVFTGIVATSIAHPSFKYCYASTTFTGAWNALAALTTSVRIYDASNAATYKCSNIVVPPPSTAGPSEKFSFDISPTTLNANGCGLPATFLFDAGDSVIISTSFKVVANIGSAITVTTAGNEFYVADIPNPVADVDKYKCDNYSGNIAIVGYYFTQYAPEVNYGGSCDPIVVNNWNYLSVGPCCGNYGGGNMFKYEFRNWAHIKQTKVIIPPGLAFTGAVWTHARTAGTGNVVTQAFPITPSKINGDTLVFDTENFFKPFGGTVEMPDDGYHSNISVTLQPTCATPTAVTQNVSYEDEHGLSAFLDVAGYPNVLKATNYDQIIYSAPQLDIKCTLPTVDGINATVSWDIIVSNNSNSSAASNNWLSLFSADGKINITDVKDLSTNTTISVSGDIYQLGTLAPQGQKTYRISATYTTCSFDSLVVYTSWNCAGYPAVRASAVCTPLQITLYLDPKPAELQMNIIGPAGAVGLCDTASYKVSINCVQIGTAYNIKVRVTLPTSGGISLESGSSQIIYPAGNAYSAISDPTLISGSTYEWDISKLNSTIGTDGLKGVFDVAKSQFVLWFKVRTDCNFVSGGVISFSSTGTSNCNAALNNVFSTTVPLDISGVTTPNTTAILLATDTIRPCFKNSKVSVQLVNLGPSITYSTDHFYFSMPQGISYVPGSFSPGKNMQTNLSPVQTTIGGVTRLDWLMPGNVGVNDSMKFSFEVSGDPAKLSCGVLNFPLETVHFSDVTCVLTQQICSIKVLTGQSTVKAKVEKANLTLVAATATSIASPPNGENISINYILHNAGQSVSAGNNVLVGIYYDTDGSGTLTPSDVFIKNDSINTSIPANNNSNYSTQLLNQNGNSCSLLLVLDTTINHCSCTNSSISVNVPFKNAGPDINFCSGLGIPIGDAAITSYTYSWNPATGLNNGNTSNPVITFLNKGNADTLVEYILTTTRNNCVSKDTVLVTIHPLPIANAGPDTSGCVGKTVQIGLTPSAGLQYSWSPAADLNNAGIANPFVTVNGPQIYTLTVTDSKGCSGTAAAALTIRANPIISSVTVIGPSCFGFSNGSISINVSGGIPGYSYSWSDGQTSATASNIKAINYTVTVSDKTGCSSFSSVQITEPQKVVSSVNPLAIICNGKSATLTASSSGGTPTYTYVWDKGAFIGNNYNVSPNTTTTYTLITLDQAGCLSDTLFTIVPVYSPVQVLNASGGIICQGDSILLSALAGGGDGNYNYTWQPAAKSIQSPEVAPFTTTQYTVSISDGCNNPSISATALVVVNPRPIPSFHADSISCLGVCTTFSDRSAISSGTISGYKWELGDGSSAARDSFTYCYPKDGVYDVKLIVTSDKGCSDSIRKTGAVKIVPLPHADFIYTPELISIIDPVVNFSDLSVSASKWEWNFGEERSLQNKSNLQNPSHTYADTGSYCASLLVLNKQGCKDSTTKCIHVEPEFAFYVPNAFTPNNDKRNDTFSGKGIGIVQFTMDVYDRWGNLIYHSDDLNASWNGSVNTSSQVAQQDVYVYKISLTDIFSRSHNYIGHVSLLR